MGDGIRRQLPRFFPEDARGPLALESQKTKAAYSGPPFRASFSLLASRAHIPVILSLDCSTSKG